MTTVKLPNAYKITFYREDRTSGGCVPDTMKVDAWTAADALVQMELIGKRRYHNDRYFAILSIEPWTEPVPV